MYIHHPRGVFLAGLKEKFLHFNTHTRLHHILFTDRPTDYVSAEDFDGVDLIL